MSTSRPSHRRWLGLAASCLLALAVQPVATAAHLAPLAERPAAAAANTGDVIANLFEWNWNSVAAECTNVLGPDGYGAVQVAPPEESITLPDAGHPWWEVYQPVGYDLNSRMGDRAQFASMVTACHAAGVKVYADAVINHTAGDNNTATTGYNGSTFSPSGFTYPQIGYTYDSFHHYGDDCPESSDQIVDWDSTADVQECELSNLSDLYTQKDAVRSSIAGYLNDLLSLGVDGFRVDAAKHIAQADMAAIISKLNNTTSGSAPRIMQEVVPGSSNSQLQPAAFESNGDVLEFNYAYDLKSQFDGSIANLKTFGTSWGLEPSDKSIAFVTNHDTERAGSTLSYKDGATFELATEFGLAWPFGTPQVYSGFTFDNSDQSPPADSNGYVTDTDCSNGWYCTDRLTGVAGMVGWHNAVGDAAVANWYDNGSNLIAFSRGDAGWIAINNGGSAVTQTFTTGLAPGTYCDVIHGTYTASTGACSGPTVTVDANGTATVTIAAKDSVALYATTTSSAGYRVTFDCTCTTTYGQNVYVSGSIPALGGWDTGKAVALSSANYPVWSATLDLPADTYFEYKYIKKDPDGTVEWESGANRYYTTGSSGSITFNDTWHG